MSTASLPLLSVTSSTPSAIVIEEPLSSAPISKTVPRTAATAVGVRMRTRLLNSPAKAARILPRPSEKLVSCASVMSILNEVPAASRTREPSEKRSSAVDEALVRTSEPAEAQSPNRPPGLPMRTDTPLGIIVIAPGSASARMPDERRSTDSPKNAMRRHRIIRPSRSS